MTPEQFARAIDKKASAFKAGARAAMAETITETQKEFVKRSSGSLTSGVLRKMGHPYATRDPQTPIDPTIINTQSGEFKRAWKKAGPRQRGGGYEGSVTNTDPKAHYMLGTKRMVARRIDQYVADQMRPRYKTKMRGALRKALRS